MRVLLGTTNPSKVKRFSDLLKGYDIEFITLRDIEVIEEPKNGLFYMIDKASSKRFEGWPLDSLSINKENGKYFVDGSIEESKENIIKDQYQKSVVDFLIKSLHIA